MPTIITSGLYFSRDELRPCTEKDVFAEKQIWVEEILNYRTLGTSFFLGILELDGGSIWQILFLKERKMLGLKLT